jgi:glycosyltransferase involved in cell wall biosynthesis
VHTSCTHRVQCHLNLSHVFALLTSCMLSIVTCLPTSHVQSPVRSNRLSRCSAMAWVSEPKAVCSAAGDVFLNTSLTEAFCMAIVEAAATGLLVVSTNVGGVPEVLPHHMCLLAEPDPEGLLRAVSTAVAQVRVRPTERQRQHEEVRQFRAWCMCTQQSSRTATCCAVHLRFTNQPRCMLQEAQLLLTMAA